MPVQPFSHLTCPLDDEPLHAEGNSWRCASGHSFDQARQGYLHLLPVQNKRSRDPGDSKAMIESRQRFLEQGFYAPIAERLVQQTLQDADPGQPLACLDAGCGEGYYLRQLSQSPAAETFELELLGLDISKWATQAAARRDKQTRWIVASNARLPLPSASLDRIWCLFGFPVYPEFARTLRPGGRLLQVDPGPEHLRQLREIIYPSLKPERPRNQEAPAGFARIDQQTLNFEITLDSPQAIADLLVMTPHLYRTTAEGRERAARLTRLQLSIDVRLQTLERLAEH